MVGWGVARAGTWAGGDGCLFEDGRFFVEDGAALELGARDRNASQKGSARQLRHFGRAV